MARRSSGARDLKRRFANDEFTVEIPDQDNVRPFVNLLNAARGRETPVSKAGFRSSHGDTNELKSARTTAGPIHFGSLPSRTILLIVGLLFAVFAKTSLANTSCGADVPYSKLLAWELTHEDRSVFIVPTMHGFPRMADERKFALRYRRFLHALIVESDTIFFERSSGEQNALPPSMSPRKKRLAEDMIDKIQKMLRHLPPDKVNALLAQEDWLIATVLNQARRARRTASSVLSGTERELLRMAQSAGVRLQGLERPGAVFTLFMSMSENAQHKMLEDALVDDVVYEEALNQMAVLFSLGRHDALCELIQQQARTRGEFWETIVTGRNIAWADEIERALPRHERALIAVGVAHTCGADSFVELLGQRGFIVSAYTDTCQ